MKTFRQFAGENRGVSGVELLIAFLVFLITGFLGLISWAISQMATLF